MQYTSATEKASIVTQLCLRAKDIKALTGYGDTTTYQIMRECREKYQGNIPMRPDAITTDSLMRYFGTNRNEYLRSLGQ